MSMTINPDKKLFEIRGDFESHEKQEWRYFDLSPPTPTPVQHRFEDTDWKGWVNAHNPAYRGALTQLIKRIEHISIQQFSQGLADAAKLFKENFDVTKNREFCVLVEPGKSYKWVAEMVYKNKLLEEMPAAFFRLGVNNASKFCLYLDQTSEPLPKDILLFDNGCYSGMQLQGHVEGIFNKYKEIAVRSNKKLDVNVWVIVTYMTNKAKKILEDVKKNLYRYERNLNKPSLSVFNARTIPTVAETLAQDDIKLLNELLWPNEEKEEQACSRGLYWFDHKIPNFKSFPSSIAEGTVTYRGKVEGKEMLEKVKTKYALLPKITPPYKG